MYSRVWVLLDCLLIFYSDIEKLSEVSLIRYEESKEVLVPINSLLIFHVGVEV